MIPKSVLLAASCLALLSALACDNAPMTEPDKPSAVFAGNWVGMKRLVSCTPAGPRCDFESVGEATYFSARLNQQGDAVDGSVILSDPSPRALPYGLFIRGQVSASAQLTFERIFFQDVGEPPYSGDFTIRALLTRRLIGRLTKQGSAGDNQTLVWEIEAVRE
jgi:hypothetical protein